MINPMKIRRVVKKGMVRTCEWCGDFCPVCDDCGMGTYRCQC